MEGIERQRIQEATEHFRARAKFCRLYDNPFDQFLFYCAGITMGPYAIEHNKREVPDVRST